MVLKIKDIIKWEILRGKSFNDFNPKETDDVLMIAYIKEKAVGLVKYTAYRHLYDDGMLDISKKISELNSYLSYVSQFLDKKRESKQSDQEVITVKDLIGQLVVAGTDASYLLDLGIEFLPWICSSIEGKAKKDAEDKRYWTMILCSPYIDSKKIKNVHDFLPFPWDKEPAKMTSEVTDEDIEMAHALFHKNKK
jgi:hypothetical protein